MKTKIDCAWKENMTFEADVQGFKLILDTDPSFGGRNLGPRPKPLTLVSLAGCTGMDVISLLKKMRIEPAYFNVSVEGELTEEHPKYYNKIHIIFEFKGDDLDLEKINKAVNLSRERYCGMSALLSFGAEITHEIKVLD